MEGRDEHRARSRREAEHFEAVLGGGHELYWADRTPAGRRRQELRAERLRRAADVEGLSGARILDIGSGIGSYTKPLARRTSATVVALDVTTVLLQHARRDSPRNTHYVAGDAGELPFPDGSFDAVVGNAVLHHLPLDHTVPELLRVLKPGGRFCFAEPNALNPQVFLERKVPFLRRWFENSPDEVAFTRWGLCQILGRLGLVELEVRPFDFLYPATPRPLISTVETLGSWLERLPLVREIAGSLLIVGRRA